MSQINIDQLKKIAVDDSGWYILYFDKKNNIYWEKSYPNSNHHGGGKPEFIQVKLSQLIKKRYKLS